MIKTFEEYSAYNKLAETTKVAAAALADAVLENIAWDFLENANDINDADKEEITFIIDLANDDKYFLNKLNKDHYSIKEIFQEKKHINTIDIIETWVEDNWEDYLNEDTVDALNDFFDMGGIIGKRQLNGGRFEAFREFQILVSDIAVSKIKEYFKMEDIEDRQDDDDDDDDEHDD